MGKFKDLAGLKFGRLTVLERAENKGKDTMWCCACDCGNKTIVRATCLKNGTVRSCGCLRKENAAKINFKHGKSYTKINRVWNHIKGRCFNANDKQFKDYGGRGITMFPAWVDDFQAFYDYVSKLPHFGEEGYSLDRIDNNGNYEPNNIRWATAKQQARNRRTNRVVTYQENEISLIEASEQSKINYETLLFRTKRGETGEYLFRLPHKRR